MPVTAHQLPLNRRLRNWLALPAMLVVAACGGASGIGEPQEVLISEGASAEGRGVFSDEPRAAFIATEILTRGGSAVDAAVAMYMAMTVTLPSSVGIGGGGSCIVSNVETDITEIIDFPLRAAVDAPESAAIPAGLRGMLLLHARHGRLPIGNLILPAERLARNGFPVSTVLADDLAAGGARLLTDPAARRLFTRGDGAFLQAGNQVVMPAYADGLRMIRGNLSGAARPFQVFKTLSGELAAAGLAVDPQRVETYSATSRPADDFEVPGAAFAENQLIFTGTDIRDTAVAAAAARLLVTDGLFDGADDLERPHLIADALVAADAYVAENGPLLPTEEEAERSMAGHEATVRRFGDQPLVRLTGAGRTPGAAVFGAIDRNSQNVVCAVTMGAPFGLGKLGPNTGMLFGAAPAQPGTALWNTRPVAIAGLIHNANSNALFALAGVSGGPGSIAVAAELMLNAVDGADAADAIAAPRIIPGPTADDVTVEEGIDVAVVDRLNSLGYKITPRGDFARAHAFVCPAGLRLTGETCSKKSDPRGAGATLGGG
ncbi:MAG: gamma-glutamyltransferase [Alphaproteobacteria bacterium]|nr:gamma-glutamyltransferase [Alphaproteobacteria bacterium]